MKATNKPVLNRLSAGVSRLPQETECHGFVYALVYRMRMWLLADVEERLQLWGKVPSR